MTLGADAANILRWMLRYGGTAVAAGLAAGVVVPAFIGLLSARRATRINSVEAPRSE